MVRSTVSSNFAYFTCLRRLTASGSGYAGLVTAARAFAIFLLDFAILPSSPTAFASPSLTESVNQTEHSSKILPVRQGPKAVVLMTAQGFPLSVSTDDSEMTGELQTWAKETPSRSADSTRSIRCSRGPSCHQHFCLAGASLKLSASMQAAGH